jgi:CheY-like chemotaxis protein
VLLNLFVNAWQAMPGGGTLFIETENVQLTGDQINGLELEPGDYVKIMISDSGVGMDEATRLRVFDPFFTTKEMGRGTGLGLASAYGIIRNHNGGIVVESQKGRGSTFTIFLPSAILDVIEEGESTSEIKKGEETILLVDDEETVLEVGVGVLEKLGYHVFTARNGEEALNVFHERRDSIDLVILDLVIPGMGGQEVFSKLKSMRRDVKVLLSSGYSIEGQAMELMENGCNGFIQKPFNIKMISEKIREVLEGG